MMKQPGQRVQADQPVAEGAAQLMPALDLFGGVHVLEGQGWQVESVKEHGLVVVTEHQITHHRHGDHEHVQGPVHQRRQGGLPGGRGRGDLRRHAQGTCQQP